MAVARGLREAVVEAAASGARDVRQHAVKDAPVLLVAIESVIEEGAQKAGALRDAEAETRFDQPICVPQQRLLGAAVFQKRHQVANGGGPKPTSVGSSAL